jgi:hypothetical protein
MKRKFNGLNQVNASSDQVPDGVFLVKVERAQYRWHANKPYYLLRLAVLSPEGLARHSITGRIYCTAKAMWKLAWFLRDFGYDNELLGKEEIDERALVNLRGVVKISRTLLHGNSVLNFDAFAPADRWEELSTDEPQNVPRSKVAG